jgi:hypothetical protein
LKIYLTAEEERYNHLNYTLSLMKEIGSETGNKNGDIISGRKISTSFMD